MTSYLLDTHIWLWALVEPNRLSAKVVKILKNPDAKHWLSPISVWEALILGEKKKIIMKPDPQRWVTTALDRSGLIEAPFNHKVAMASRRLKSALKDPADRFIMATSLTLDVPLITADEKILKSRNIKTLKA